MHWTLKTEATKPAAANALPQQGRFDAFVERYNQQRPHQALGMRVPSDLYTPSARPYRGLCELDYPFSRLDGHRDAVRSHLLNRGKISLSVVFAGRKQNGGVKQIGDRVWLVSLMNYDLGYFDDETCRLEPIDNPFGPKVLPMYPAPSVRIVVCFAPSITAISLVFSIFTKTAPFPSATGNSGLPPRAIVPATVPVLASIAVALFDRPLKVKTFPETGSKAIPSGSFPVAT
jgi:hypothetical protein